MADAETAPLPKIVIEEPPPPPPVKRPLFARLGDVPMRVIYRGVVGGVAALAVAAAAVVFFVTGWDRGTPTAAGPSDVESLVTPPAPGSASAAAPLEPVPSGSVPSGSVPSGSPEATSSASVSASVSVSAPAPVSAQGTASPVASPTPGKSALDLAKADPRVPRLPAERKLRAFRGHGTPTKGRVKDKRSGITFARFTKTWKRVTSSPFATRRVLPGAKGAKHRGLLATCPVPIAVQDQIRDTAFLAARWTLNYHPAGSKISWTASQPIKAGKREGWLLGYRVHYKVGGKNHQSTAAVALVEVPSGKPALVFITIPDAQKKRWSDITTLITSLRPI
ncbi:hypothetical protein [Sphaerisporangium corydalis]|uniref:Serine/threonine protein kinase n=1 Tax=Sphaerisporangium corydalis TaxID=1441875 RepID=A0ABV9ELI1_9ACTN|nr:hypothetical protein [Sphaerisporangium corydalis]